MKILFSDEFREYWKNQNCITNDEKTENAVKEIIEAVRKEGDSAIYMYASKFDKSSPKKLEVPLSELDTALIDLAKNDPELVKSLCLSANNIYKFSQKQREQFKDFETELTNGVFTGQRIIPVERAAVYVPGGRSPLISSVLMTLLPAFCANVNEVYFTSPPCEAGLPDRRILACAAIALNTARELGENTYAENLIFRTFAIGGAQAIAAFAFGTKQVPRADVIAGPGNRFVSCAKRQLYGQVGIDLIAGPSDILVIAEPKSVSDTISADLIAADLIAQAEHDTDARARVLVTDLKFAELISLSVNNQLKTLANPETARSSLEAGGIITVCSSMEEALEIANIIAPEHLELLTGNNDKWIPKLKNYGSLFIGDYAAEVLGDYSAGLNHTLPTSGSSRFTGGLSVRNFLKTVTTLRCSNSSEYINVCKAANIIAKAEGLEEHAKSAEIRIKE